MPLPTRLWRRALGYEEVPAFNDGRYAEHRLAKPLALWLMAPKLHPVCRSLGDESRGHRVEAGRLAPDPCGVPCFIAPCLIKEAGNETAVPVLLRRVSQ